jgi:hypothetical protein
LPSAKPAAAQNSASAIASPNAVESFFNGKIPAAIANGKINVNVRARYEQADEEGVAAIKNTSYAPTIRTRVSHRRLAT